MRKILLILFLIVSAVRSHAQTESDEGFDSLKTVFFSLSDRDTSKLSICREIASGLENLDSTIAWADRLIRLAEYQDHPIECAYGYFYKSWAYYYKRDYAPAFENGFQSLLMADSLRDNPLRIKVNMMIGHNYFSMKNYEDCGEFYLRALEIARLEADTMRICQCMRVIADTYTNKSMYAKAQEMYEQTYTIDSIRGDLDNMRRDYHGVVYILMAQYFDSFTNQDISLIHRAKEYISKVNSIESRSIYSKYVVLKPFFVAMLAELQYYDYQGPRRAGILDTMRNILSTAREYSRMLDLGPGAFYDEICNLNYLTASGRYTEADCYIDSLQRQIDSDSSTYYVYNADLDLARDYYYRSIGRMDSAYYYKTRYFEYEISQLSPDYAIKATQDWERAQYNEKIRIREQRMESRQRIFYSVLAGIVVLILFFLVDYLRKRRHNIVLNGKNQKLMQQKEEIRAQSEEISKKNIQITSSISYASIIQQAVLPKDDYMKSLFADYFLIYKPLSIVSGDFYWASNVQGRKVLVCADCTGHGVPGAFVSMLGVSLLNDIVPAVMLSAGSASDILDELRNRLMHSLGQSRDLYDDGLLQNKDGMDLAIIIHDPASGHLQYAGANRPLWIFRNGCVEMIKPDRMPIGLYLGPERNFQNHDVDVFPGDRLYMFSDGVIDQFGYTNAEHTQYKRFSTRQFQTLITSIGALPLSEQEGRIEAAIHDWENGHPQSDDIIVIGVEV